MKKSKICSAFGILALILSLLSTSNWNAAASEALPAVTGNEILTISGKVELRNMQGGAALSLDFLKSMPALTIKTTTPWTTGQSVFVGVRLRDLLTRLGATPVNGVEAHAINDYVAQIPLADFKTYDVIIAYSLDGKPLGDTPRGPLWIIYPYSDDGDLQQDVFYARGVWQLNRLVVN